MFLLPALAAIAASAGWAAGSVLAQPPARALGVFAFTRVQLIACGAILLVLCAALDMWESVDWRYWPYFLVSILVGTIVGNLTTIACLVRAGPRRSELILTMRGPATAIVAYLWLGETISLVDLAGMLAVVGGILIAIENRDGGPSSRERPGHEPIQGSLVALLALGAAATFSQGLGFLVMKPAMLAGTEPLAASAIRVAGAAVFVTAAGLIPLPATRSLTPLTMRLAGQAVLPGIIGYVLSSSLLLYAFANANSGIASVLGTLSPVIVLLFVWIKERRPPTRAAFLGTVLAIAGTATIVTF